MCARTQRISPWDTTLWLAPAASLWLAAMLSASSGAAWPVYEASLLYRSRRWAGHRVAGGVLVFYLMIKPYKKKASPKPR